MAFRLNIVTLKLIRDHTLASEVKKITCSEDAANVLFKYLNGVDREHFVALYLDIKHCITAIHTVSVGSLNATIVHPREVFKGALLANAAALIVGHNHIVIGDRRHVSLRERGLLNN